MSAFQLKSTDGLARRGSLTTAHGVIETPVFMPVATTGAIKGIVPLDLESMQARVILGNTYHLFLRPGLDIIKKFGGLHQFMGWNRALLTDSGGFQIFSLGRLNKIDEEGVVFQSHIDGKRIPFTPESVVEIQEAFGSDIHMVLDECTPYPATHEVAKLSLERTTRWAKRCRAAKTRQELLQFGIVQGSVYEDLRRQSVDGLLEIGFDGYAIGGLSVGEEKPHMRAMTAWSCELLPKDQARYLMGVGTPMDLLESVALGVDMFDCVMPSRNARRGTLFTSRGKVALKNTRFRNDEEPLDPDCNCYTCKTFSKAFLRHMYFANDVTSHRLLTLHNLTYYLHLMSEVRVAIEEGRFAKMLAEQRIIYGEVEPDLELP